MLHVCVLFFATNTMVLSSFCWSLFMSLVFSAKAFTPNFQGSFLLFELVGPRYIISSHKMLLTLFRKMFLGLLA